MSKNLIENLRGILNDKIHVQHNDGEVTGYAHSYCNEKVREDKSKITVIAHNLLRFDFFFLVKGIRAKVWLTKGISIPQTSSSLA